MTINILQILKKSYQHRSKILTIAIIILVVLFMKQCQKHEYEMSKAKQNEAYYKNELKSFKNKAGEYQTERAILVASMNELKKDTSKLAQEVKKLKNQKPKIVIRTVIEYRDSGSVENSITQLDTNKYSINFEYRSSDGTMFISGKNNFLADPIIKDNKLGLKLKSDRTYLDSISLRLALTLGIKEEKGVEKVFAVTGSDKIKVTEIEAVELEKYYKKKFTPKTKRFGIGPFAGAGITAGPKGINYGFTIGMGIQYNFIRF